MEGGLSWYFAYGSNMQRATLCERRGIVCRQAIAARVPGWRVVFDKPPLVSIGESFANLIPEPAGSALGVLVEISSEDLDHIDLTEGVLIGNYDRVAVTAHRLGDDAPPIDAYSLTSHRRDASLRPSPRYMGLVIEGAIEHGLPAEYVETLRAVVTGTESMQAGVLRPMLDAVMRRR
jgi:hypothetical protein